MATIKGLQAKEVLDSQGNPTIHVAMWLDTGDVVETSVPNGIHHYSTEAQTLHDKDPQHMDGKGVQKAVLLVNKTLAPKLIGQDPIQQEKIDQLLIKLDATADKSQAGANTLIAISQATLKAAALVSGMQLYQYIFEKYKLANRLAIPTCIYGLVNGGLYGSNNLDLQEFLIIPASYSDYRVSLEVESALRAELKKVLQEKGANYSTGALGGFTPYLQRNIDVFEFIVEAARKTPYILARDFFFGIDAGGENLMKKGKYVLKDKATTYTEDDLREYYQTLQKKYNLNYFEDPFAIKDEASWERFTADLGKTTKIVGDALTATNPKLAKEAIEKKYCNSLIVKPSQIGTLTETLEAVRIAREAGWSIIVSQRTGETNDDFLADFAVGIGADFVKFGPVKRGESVAKYNRLADIYLALEKLIKEGKDMQPNQPNTNGDDASAPQDKPVVDPAAPATPAADLPEPTDAPVAPVEAPAPVAPVAPANDEMPAAPAATPVVAPTPDPVTSTVGSEAPVNTPPAAAPMAKPEEPVKQPSVADTQEAIDTTLQEIGAKPGADAATTAADAAKPTE